MSPQLPASPSLERLRKQAKSLLKAHRRRDPSACDVLRQLRQFADRSDDDILDAPLKLDDVQFALAMDYGFKNWAELKEGVRLQRSGVAGTKMLHVHCGDSSAGTLRRSDVPGDIIVWCDPLMEGPAPAGLSEEEWRRARAAYHVSAGYAKDIEANLYWQQRQNEALEAFPSCDEVVLWFDACLFDQVILIRHLDWFSRRDTGTTGLSLICIGEFAGFEKFRGLGQLDPGQLGSLLKTRHEVTQEELDLGVKAWAAYRSADPTAIEELLATDTSALPHLKQALTHHLQLFPSTKNGLNIVEESILRHSARLGLQRAAKLIGEVLSRTDLPFLSDAQVSGCAKGMAAANVRLLDIGHLFDVLSSEGRKQIFVITEAGRDVLDGRADAIELNGIDRWLGGVHLRGLEAQWRWDTRQGRLVQRRTDSFTTEAPVKPVPYVVSEDMCDPAGLEALDIAVTEVLGELPEVTVGKTYLVRGTYRLKEPTVSALVLSCQGRSQGRRVSLRIGTAPFTLTANVLEVLDGGTKILDILMVGEDGSTIGVRCRIVLDGR